jgi:anaerobic magnesium-protoporphyrin IX monomethyl ester cyclase
MDNKRLTDALLVGYERQENLGLRSLKAYLLSRGRSVELVPYRPGQEDDVLSAARSLRPCLIGFSIIYQNGMEDFAKLLQHLRAHGVTAHFTAGGHFPSLRPELTLRLLPELDTIVRFEGELTLSELLDAVDEPRRWRAISGLAYRSGAEVVLNEPRPLVANLDSLPLVARDELFAVRPGVTMASMLASRGCLHGCSFCSIREFYGSCPGERRRARSPAGVAEEMQRLHGKDGVRFFSFQDDDFAARTTGQRSWLAAFLYELDARKLSGRVKWKISCRVDDLDAQILGNMIQGGLVGVYLGVESGSARGLHTLNKQTTVGQNRAAIELIKRHDVALGMGFMLFDPSSTVETLRENIAFLQSIGSDGYFPINFCKMLPYAGTPIEAELLAQGRLHGTPARPDYGFLDTALEWYELFVAKLFSRRNFQADGIVSLLQQADMDRRLADAFAADPPSKAVGQGLRRITAQVNQAAVETLEELLEELLSRGAQALIDERKTLVGIAEREWRAEADAEIAVRKLGFAV